MKTVSFPLLYAIAFVCILSGALLQACGATTVDCKDPANAQKASCLPHDVVTAGDACLKQQLDVSLLGQVAQAFASDDYEQSLADLGKTHLTTLVDCTAVGVYNVWTGKSAASSGSGGGLSTSQPDPKALRAQTYLAKKHLLP